MSGASLAVSCIRTILNRLRESGEDASQRKPIRSLYLSLPEQPVVNIIGELERVCSSLAASGKFLPDAFFCPVRYNRQQETGLEENVHEKK